MVWRDIEAYGAGRCRRITWLSNNDDRLGSFLLRLRDMAVRIGD
jgi:hypothetical protein